MTTEEKLDHILTVLTTFMEKQEVFNAKQESTNARLEVGLDSLRREFSEFRYQEELQHNATHRLIM